MQFVNRGINELSGVEGELELHSQGQNDQGTSRQMLGTSLKLEDSSFCELNPFSIIPSVSQQSHNFGDNCEFKRNRAGHQPRPFIAFTVN